MATSASSSSPVNTDMTRPPPRTRSAGSSPLATASRWASASVSVVTPPPELAEILGTDGEMRTGDRPGRRPGFPATASEVARWFREIGQRVVVTGPARQRPLAERVAALAELPDEAVLA